MKTDTFFTIGRYLQRILWYGIAMLRCLVWFAEEPGCDRCLTECERNEPMNRNGLLAIVVGIVVALGVAGALVYNSFLGDTQEASGPITAIPIATTAPAAEPTAAPAAEPTAAPAAEPTAAPAAGSDAAPNSELIFQIISDESKASFILQEDLRGERIDVVGTTTQVAGQIAINPSDLSTAKIGVIQVNARTIETDNSNRNRAIRNRILETDSYEFITFTPKSIEGLSGTGAPNNPYTFTISGDLTIRDVTMPVVFEATVTANSAAEVTGSASTVIKHADFGLSIPSVPFVANVTDEVTLKLEFVARTA
jgi:polyisoprenoid-binding protein YceI